MDKMTSFCWTEPVKLNNILCDQRQIIHTCIWDVWNYPMFLQQLISNSFHFSCSKLHEFCKNHHLLNRLLSNSANISEVVSFVENFYTYASRICQASTTNILRIKIAKQDWGRRVKVIRKYMQIGWVYECLKIKILIKILLNNDLVMPLRIANNASKYTPSSKNFYKFN